MHLDEAMSLSLGPSMTSATGGPKSFNRIPDTAFPREWKVFLTYSYFTVRQARIHRFFTLFAHFDGSVGSNLEPLEAQVPMVGR